MLRSLWVGLTVGLLGTLAAATSVAEESAQNGRAWGIADNCIDNHRVRSVRFLDDRSAVIDLAGERQVLMTLQHRCPGIRNRGFLHETSINKLCASDSLRVIDTGFICLVDGFAPYLGETGATDVAGDE